MLSESELGDFAGHSVSSRHIVDPIIPAFEMSEREIEIEYDYNGCFGHAVRVTSGVTW